MSPSAPRARPALLLLVWTILGASTDAKYASGARRSGHRLSTEPLEERQAASVTQCLALCGALTDCVALNFGTITYTANCQLLGQRACDGLPLVADAAVNYYDVYDEPQNGTSERQMPFWDDPGCVQDGYCAAECAAKAAGDFCTVDAHCRAHPKPSSVYGCSNSTCQPSADFWEMRPGVALPRWQLWRLDPFQWAWKKLKPGTCSLDVSLKLGVGAVAHISACWLSQHIGTRLTFRFTNSVMDLYYSDSASTLHYLVLGVNIDGMVNSDTYSLLKISWCGGNMAIGPASNPTLVTAYASVSQSIDFVMVYSANADSWMTVDSGVADPWLFEESGVATDAVITVPSDSYVHRRITATRSLTLKFDCKALRDCAVRFRGETRVALNVVIGGWDNTATGLIYYGDIGGQFHVVSSAVLSDTEFNTFTVHYNNGSITVYHNEAATPFYTATAPHAMPDITLIGIGSCCGPKTIRVARYDPAWRTDTWLTEGSGYSNGDEPEPAP
ncbi:hypothetical protein FJT64_026955 [Amphibalanus amphitrite]|uniref:Farnesoic acid O-methyl transferase domain-containing protein n=1 Tax=Amphibalanus amphitrite TaxID=1232801 RepID=A0A6A4W290_AMPAM|nr:hypothetical protein FJT64_026955 [Amphibalanus amphitrite]